MEELLRITLELEPGAEPIAGRLYADMRPDHFFHGWLEFAAAIECACKEGAPGPALRRGGTSAAREPRPEQP